MRLAIPAQGPGLDARIDSRFGRAAYFVIVDSETGQCSAHDNAANADSPQGTGVQAAQAVVNLGAEAVLSGTVGPKAFAVLQAAGISTYLSLEGTVADAIASFRSGRLCPSTQANVAGHHG